MAVHWRSGFRRLVSVLAWIYWLLAAWIIYAQATGSMKTYNPDTYEYTFHWDRYPAGLHTAGEATVDAMLIFAALWAATLGLRWIARGFADGEA